jgi:hypothetical protein
MAQVNHFSTVQQDSSICKSNFMSNNNNIIGIDEQRDRRDTFEPSEETKAKKYFTVVNQDFIQNRDLSIEARMVIVYLMSLPIDWTINSNNLQYQLGVGRDKLSKSMRELKEAGYMQRTPIKGRSGRIDRWHTKYSDRPEFLPSVHTTENQSSGESTRSLKIHNVDFPYAGKHPLQNKQYTNKTIKQKKNNKQHNTELTRHRGNRAEKIELQTGSDDPAVVFLYESLISHGLNISKRTLSQWMGDYGQEHIQRNLVYTMTKMKMGKVSDASAYLAQAILEDYAVKASATILVKADKPIEAELNYDELAATWKLKAVEQKREWLKKAMTISSAFERNLGPIDNALTDGFINTYMFRMLIDVLNGK